MLARRYTQGSEQVEDIDLEALPSRVDDRSLLWLDGAADEETLASIGQKLGLQGSLAGLPEMPPGEVIFDAASIRLSVVAILEAADERGSAAHGQPSAAGPGHPRSIETLEVSAAPTPTVRHGSVRIGLLLARNVVVSLHDRPVRGLADPVRMVAHDPRFGRLDAGRFAGLLLDGVLDGYDGLIEDLEREIDALDQLALRAEPREALLEDLVGIRRQVALLRRSLAPQRAAVVALTRPIDDKPSPIGAPDPELLAHLDRTIAALERLRDQLLGTFDILMTRTAQRTNDIVRVLTVVSAVLLPAGVIAGIMGMNFQPDFFDQPVLFFVVLAAMAVLAVATLVVARWRHWV